MLKLVNIKKDYLSGDSTVKALKGISIEFRKSEFVAILGHSGCGKTTLLNIIGGLDHYTSGDLIISGRSTKEYRDNDWDNYRNHSIGFVFQSYNLIPHQTILANVELALTLSGVSKAERRRRAEDALKTVGLGDMLKKKPNQLSGGQMQRVAIARALVNNPEILLADEATGALDSETSVQIMDLLKEVSKSRLVIMVTHNPELAAAYATRTVRLVDGLITDDTAPYSSANDEQKTVPEKSKAKKKAKREKMKSMSLLTALSLSFNNLMTKKTRTLLTSFAGSIGIIGIALILSVSTGVQTYINRVQEDTLSSYPLTIQSETMDMSGLVESFMNTNTENEENVHEDGKVYASSVMIDLLNSLNSIETEKNNLKDFKTFLDNDEELKKYVSAVQYSYDFDLNIFTEDKDGNISKSDAMELITTMMSELYGSSAASMLTQSGYSSSSYEIWEELLHGDDGELINPLVKDQYDLVYGNWPENYNDVVLVLNSNNELSDIVLYALGLKTESELQDEFNAVMNREVVDVDKTLCWTYEEITDVDLKLLLSADLWQKGTDGEYVNLSQTETGIKYLYNSDNAIELNICGIIKPNEDATANMITGSICYTSALTDKIISLTDENELLNLQKDSTDTDVLTGLKFKTGEEEELTAEQISEKVNAYLSSSDTKTKAEIFSYITCIPTEEYLNTTAQSYLSQYDRATMEQMLTQGYAEQMGVENVETVEQYVKAMSDEELASYMLDIIKQTITEQYAEGVKAGLSDKTENELAYMLDATELTDEQYSLINDKYLPLEYSESTYEENLSLLGNIDKDEPYTISIYASTFEDKDEISAIIDEYNDSVSEENKISYTDYVALIMSSVSTIINAISYVLIAFVGISLVVSSIMIGVITYISVLERTKEIGILRAIGASKKDISRVFNAETLVVGFVSGAMGVIITLLLLIPINIILTTLTGISILKAILPTESIFILVAISMFLTFIAGLIPSGIAAKKDPVEALRTE